MQFTLQFVCILMLLAAGTACAYLSILAMVATLPLRRRGQTSKIHRAPTTSFAIVIPAHNEETGIAQTVGACRALDYPAERMRIVVLADNCDDRTAEVAARAGAEIMTRRDPGAPGKGAALGWALPRVLANGCDAVVIVDADSEPDARMLRVFDRHLARGARVLQGAIEFTNADQSAISYLACIGNVIENEFLCAPKQRLGLPVFLRGSGMVFAREVFSAAPWRAESAVEDHEFTMRLLRHGERVEYVGAARVLTQGAESRSRLQAQRRRWAGALSGALGNAARLCMDGFRQRRWYLIDAAITQLTMSRPLVAMQLALTMVLCWYAGAAFFAVCLVLAAIHCALIVMAAIRLGITQRRLGFVITLPIAIVELLGATLRGMLGVSGGWTRR